MVTRYAQVVLLHKWAIVAAGLDVKRKLSGTGMTVSLRRLLAHDLSKLSPAEFMPYARHFCGDKPVDKRAPRDPEFELAWQHHFRHNDHHPEHFQEPDGHFRQMPDEAVVEMVVDWMAATRAYEGHWPCCGGHWRWIEDSWDRLELHPINKAFAGAIVCALGYNAALPEFDWAAAIKLVDDPELGQRLERLRRQAETTAGPIRWSEPSPL
jgi:hypothetical protein